MSSYRRRRGTPHAWAIKETLRKLWHYRSEASATRFFNQWFGWAKRSKLTPIKQAADMIKSRLQNVVSYCTLPITNVVAEGS